MLKQSVFVKLNGNTQQTKERVMKKIIAIISVLLVAVSLNAQGKFALSVNGDVALPMGNFGDIAKTGFGGLVAGVYSINDNLQATLKAGYLTWSTETPANLAAQVAAQNANLEEGTLTSIPVLVGARYVAGKGKLKPYGAAELGMHFTSTEVPSVTLPTGQTVGGGTTSDSNFGFGFGGGVYYEVAKTVDLELNAQYNIISTSGSSSGFINVGVGALFHL